MKYIFRTALGVVFTFFLLLLLFASAVKFELLSTKFWTRGIERSGIYQDLTANVDKLQSQIDRSGGKGRIVLREIVTETRIQEVVEKNISRLVDYLSGNTKKLAIYLPLSEWKLPKELFEALPKLSYSAEMDLDVVLSEMGYPPQQTAEIIKALSGAQSVFSSLIWVWLGLLVMTLVLLAAHYFLGDGKQDKIKGSSLLLLGSGLITALIGWGGGRIGDLIASSARDWPVWQRALVVGWTAEFFSLGKVVGLIITIVGAALFVWVSYFMKTAKGKESKKEMSFAKRLFQTVLGVILGIILLIVMIGLTVVAFGGKISVKANP